jgi:hypothetical protein
VLAKLGVSVCGGDDAIVAGLPPARVSVSHDRALRRVNRFVVANGLTYVFSTFKD